MFFVLYPAATGQELSYYVGGALPVIGNESYVFAGLVNPVFTKSGDTVTAHVVVQYLDRRVGMTRVLQFELLLKNKRKLGKSEHKLVYKSADK